MNNKEEIEDDNEEKNEPKKGIAALLDKIIHNKKLLVIVISCVVLVIGLTVFFILKTKRSASASSTHNSSDKSHTKVSGPFYIELPIFLVNINRVGSGSSFLKMKLSVEVASQEDVDPIKIHLPRIQDSFNTYLRELKIDDVKGSAAIYRMREELLTRINKTVNPNKVTDILFIEIITQ